MANYYSTLSKQEIKSTLLRLLADIEEYPEDKKFCFMMDDNCGGYTYANDGCELHNGLDGVCYIELK